MYKTGDIVFAHGKGFVSRAIQLAEWLRWRRGDEWNHVGIITEKSKGGYLRIVQAESRGVTSKWFKTPQEIAPGGRVKVLSCPSPEWTATIRFANRQVGTDYGFITILSVAVSIIAPWFLTIRKPSTWICSALVAESLRAGGWQHNWPDIYMVSPAELFEAVSKQQPNK